MALSNQQLVDLGRKYETQFNFVLPDGTIIPAGINPGQAATVNIVGDLYSAGSVLRRDRRIPSIEELTTEEKGGLFPKEILDRDFLTGEGSGEAAKGVTQKTWTPPVPAGPWIGPFLCPEQPHVADGPHAKFSHQRAGRNLGR